MSPELSENFTGISIDPIMHVDIKSDIYFDATGEGGEAVRGNYVAFGPGATQHEIDHEIGHFFGVGHSYYSGSLMLPVELPTSSSINHFNQPELVQFINTYRK